MVQVHCDISQYSKWNLVESNILHAREAPRMSWGTKEAVHLFGQQCAGNKVGVAAWTLSFNRDNVEQEHHRVQETEGKSN